MTLGTPTSILKQTGGYNAVFLNGRQCFMLLGYYYYYGTKRNWHPKVNYNSSSITRWRGRG